MHSLVPRTALKGRSRSLHDEVAKGLGYFSIALGIAELVAPRTVCRAVGIAGQENLVRAYGAREIATGIAILASHDATPWIWGRVAGDALDIATVAASPERKGDNGRILGAHGLNRRHCPRCALRKQPHRRKGRPQESPRRLPRPQRLSTRR